MIRIGLSYHGGKPAYDYYASALDRRAKALNIPVEISWLAGTDRALENGELQRIDAVCLTGGADVHPSRYGRPDAQELCHIDARRDEVEWAVLENLERRPRPVLAICRGAQILNVFYGGTLIPDLAGLNAAHRPETDFMHHTVGIEAGTLLNELSGVGEGTVNSSHHQAVERVAPGFRVSAYAPDGVIEAFEPEKPGSRPFLLAVQWHPERMAAGEILADRVLDAFLMSTAANGFPVEHC